MNGHISTVAFIGIEAKLVDVQVRMMGGAVAFAVVGLPDKMVAESRERVCVVGLGISSQGAGSIPGKPQSFPPVQPKL